VETNPPAPAAGPAPPPGQTRKGGWEAPEGTAAGQDAQLPLMHRLCEGCKKGCKKLEAGGTWAARALASCAWWCSRSCCSTSWCRRSAACALATSNSESVRSALRR